MGLLLALASALKDHLGSSPRNRPFNTGDDSCFRSLKFALMPCWDQPVRIGGKRSPNIIQCRELLLDRHLIYRVFHHWHSLAPSLYAAYYSIIPMPMSTAMTLGRFYAKHEPQPDNFGIPSAKRTVAVKILFLLMTPRSLPHPPRQSQAYTVKHIWSDPFRPVSGCA